jgi:putative restriction endonuclease
MFVLMAGRPWSREETLAALNLYCRTPFGRLHARNPDIVALAAALDRTPSSVAMKCCNLASLDPAQRARGVSGLDKASQLDQAVWAEFHHDPETVGYESEISFAKLTRQPPRIADAVQWEDVQGLDKRVIAKMRVNQHLFRSMILAGYRNECAVCRLPIPTLLEASHIVPWSIDKSVRMNPHNGICLCALHDQAFDVGILRIRPDYRIAVSPFSRPVSKAPAVDRFLIAYDNESIALPDRWHPHGALLKRHFDAPPAAKPATPPPARR